MASRKSYTNSFAGGEISPLMLGHIEDEGYRTGFARGRNMVVLPTGAATKRPQLEFVRAAKPGAAPVRLFPFVYGDGDAYAMEWGPNHVRFHAEGSTLLYATPIPVASVSLADDTFTTTAAHGLAVNDAVRITHKGTNIPGDLLTGNTYYVRTVVSAKVFTLSATMGPGALLDLVNFSAIDETSFWRQSELPREYVQARNVARTGNQLDSVSDHGLVATHGDGIRFTTSGTLPSNSFDLVAVPALVVGTVYYARYIDANSFEVATTKEAAQASAFTFTAAVATDILTAVAHGLSNGSSVRLTSTGSLPTPLVVLTNFYVIEATADTFQLATSPGGVAIDITNAFLGNTHTATPRLALDTSGSGVHTFHYAYAQGDIVWGGSLTLLGSTSSRLFWAIENLPTSIPTVAEWHQMPADGVYELYTTMGDAALASLNYDQSYDVWTLTKPQSAAFTLGREGIAFPSGSSATADVIRWAFRAVDPSPGPPAPVLSLSSRAFGEYYSITWQDGTPTATNIAVLTVPVTNTVTNPLIAGDVVYMEATLGGADAVTGVAGTPGFFLLSNVGVFGGLGNREELRFLRIDGGTEVANASGSNQAGFIRLVGSSSNLTESYVVTAIRDGDESLASDVVTVTSNLEVPGSSNVMVWSAVTGAQRYRIYKQLDESYGLLAETSLLTFTDDGIGPDLGVQPPDYDDSLTTESPSASAFFQQRQWFGGTVSNPRRVWGSKTGTVSTMSYHERLLLATDRIRFDVAARERTLVRHIVPAAQLWLMTSAAEIKVTGVNSDVLTPASIDPRPLSQIGCTIVRPIVANSNILFVGARDQHVYELPSQTFQIVDPPDLSVRSAHLFDGYELEQSAQQSSPVPIQWYVRDDGSLLGMTYMPAQNIRGWHVHTAAGTDAAIQSICVIPDSDGDRPYALVSRTINGSTVLYIERMGRIETPATMTACRFFDSCLSYSGAATTTIPVPHLPGEVVYAVADGVVRGPFTVTAGTSPSITLTTAASTVHVGLLYTAELRSLPPAMLVDGFGKGRELNVNHVSLRVDNSCSFKVAAYQDDDDERGVVRRPWAVPGLGDTRMRSKDVEASIDGGWSRNAQVVLTQDVPLPLTVVSMTVDVEAGGP